MRVFCSRVVFVLLLLAAAASALAADSEWKISVADVDYDNYPEMVVEGPWVYAVFQNNDPKDLGFHGATPFVLKGYGNIASTVFASMFDVEHIFISGYDLRIGKEESDKQGAAWYNHWLLKPASGADDPFKDAPPHTTLRSSWIDQPGVGIVTGHTGMRFECDWAFLKDEKTLWQRIAIVNDTPATHSATILAGYPGFTLPASNPLGSTSIFVSAVGQESAYTFTDGVGFYNFPLERHLFKDRRAMDALNVPPVAALPFQILEFANGKFYCVSTILNPHECNTTGVGTINDQRLFHSSSLLNLFNEIDVPPRRTAAAHILHHFYEASGWDKAREAAAQWASAQRAPAQRAQDKAR